MVWSHLIRMLLLCTMTASAAISVCTWIGLIPTVQNNHLPFTRVFRTFLKYLTILLLQWCVYKAMDRNVSHGSVYNLMITLTAIGWSATLVISVFSLLLQNQKLSSFLTGMSLMQENTNITPALNFLYLSTQSLQIAYFSYEAVVLNQLTSLDNLFFNFILISIDFAFSAFLQYHRLMIQGLSQKLKLLRYSERFFWKNRTLIEIRQITAMHDRIMNSYEDLTQIFKYVNVSSVSFYIVEIVFTLFINIEHFVSLMQNINGVFWIYTYSIKLMATTFEAAQLKNEVRVQLESQILKGHANCALLLLIYLYFLFKEKKLVKQLIRITIDHPIVTVQEQVGRCTIYRFQNYGFFSLSNRGWVCIKIKISYLTLPTCMSIYTGWQYDASVTSPKFHYL